MKPFSWRPHYGLALSISRRPRAAMVERVLSPQPLPVPPKPPRGAKSVRLLWDAEKWADILATLNTGSTAGLSHAIEKYICQVQNIDGMVGIFGRGRPCPARLVPCVARAPDSAGEVVTASLGARHWGRVASLLRVVQQTNLVSPQTQVGLSECITHLDRCWWASTSSTTSVGLIRAVLVHPLTSQASFSFLSH